MALAQAQQLNATKTQLAMMSRRAAEEGAQLRKARKRLAFMQQSSAEDVKREPSAAKARAEADEQELDEAHAALHEAAEQTLELFATQKELSTTKEQAEAAVAELQRT